MNNTTITGKDKVKAQVCDVCLICKRARKKQKGLAYWFVKKVEGNICSFCIAYEKVYGRKAHEPIPEEVS